MSDPKTTAQALPADERERLLWLMAQARGLIAHWDEFGREHGFDEHVEYRRMEEANRRHCEEDTELHRALHRKDSDHQQALLREEEKGYARGLRDATRFPADAAAAAAPVVPADFTPYAQERVDFEQWAQRNAISLDHDDAWMAWLCRALRCDFQLAATPASAPVPVLSDTTPELPPLPGTAARIYFTRDEMRSYALAALTAERHERARAPL